MNVTLLGTASAEGWPAIFCDCDSCSRARALGGKNIRSRSAALIGDDLKIDLPPDTLHHVHAYGLDLTKLTHLLITHGHDDHVTPSELQYMTWMFTPMPRTAPLVIAGPPAVLDRLAGALDPSLPIIFQHLTPWTEVSLGTRTVLPVVANHDPDTLCYNYLIAEQGRALLYATDTGWYAESTWQALAGRHVDAVVLECTNGLKTNGWTGHLNVPGVLAFRDRLISEDIADTKTRIVTTHHSHLGEMLHDSLEAYFAPHGITVGFDGIRFDV